MYTVTLFKSTGT